MNHHRPFVAIVTALVAALLAAPAGAAIDIVLDYQFDTNHFFDSTGTNPNWADACARMDDAATYFEGVINDTLAGITPGGSNTWDQVFYHPGTGAQTTVTDAVVPAGTITVYLGARAMTALGRGGPGGWSASGSTNFLDSIRYRGQSGVGTTDVAPWGGTISFDIDQDWHFGADAPTPYSSVYDFYSVALHEMGHVMGFGTADSWDAHLATENTTRVFTGPASSAANAAIHPGVSTDDAHWASGLGSYVGPAAQETAMDPGIYNGDRKLFTLLDEAALDDVGWDMTYSTTFGGDANLDRAVGLTDLSILAGNYGGSEADWLAGDFDGDGTVGLSDLSILAGNYDSAYQAVPEPSGAAMLLAIMGLVLRRGDRK